MHDMRPATSTLAALVKNVDDAQLGAATPCSDYTVADLLDHIGGMALAFTSAARKEDGPNATPPPLGDGAHLGAGWRDRIPADLESMADAWATGEAWNGITKIAGMEMPASVVGTVGLNEAVTHGWDLSRATGQPFQMDEGVIQACFEFVGPMSQPGAEAARAPAFGPVVTVADTEPALDRLVAMTGRDPAWTAP